MTRLFLVRVDVPNGTRALDEERLTYEFGEAAKMFCLYEFEGTTPPTADVVELGDERLKDLASLMAMAAGPQDCLLELFNLQREEEQAVGLIKALRGA